MNFVCLDCNIKMEIDAPTKQSAIDIARAKKWAVSRGRNNCYCPDCAVSRRNVGKKGGKRTLIQQRIDVI